MTTASVGFHCPDCLKSNKQQVLSRTNNFGVSERPPVVMGLIIINVLVFIYDIVSGANIMGSGLSDVANDFGLLGIAVDMDNEWYRVLSSGFVHSGIIHVAFNMYLLYALGRSLETRYGSLTFGGLYLAGLFGGALGALLVEPRALVVGASGAVFALMGFLVMVQRKQGINFFSSGVGRLVMLNILFSFSGGISLGGHGGGLICGLIAGALVTEVLPNMGQKGRKVEAAAMFALALVLALAVIPAVSRASDLFFS